MLFHSVILSYCNLFSRWWRACGNGMARHYGLNRLSENQVHDATVCWMIRNKTTRFQPSSICGWSLSTTPSDTLVYNLMRKFGSWRAGKRWGGVRKTVPVGEITNVCSINRGFHSPGLSDSASFVWIYFKTKFTPPFHHHTYFQRACQKQKLQKM